LRSGLTSHHDQPQFGNDLCDIQAVIGRFFADLQRPCGEGAGLFRIADREKRIADGVGRYGLSRLVIQSYLALAVVQLLHIQNHGAPSTPCEVQYLG
jgi:hypothetical protein